MSFAMDPLVVTSSLEMQDLLNYVYTLKRKWVYKSQKIRFDEGRTLETVRQVSIFFFFFLR